MVLLDHGLYKELDDSIRITYASLWKVLCDTVPNFVIQNLGHIYSLSSFIDTILWSQGLVFSDAKVIKENSMKLGAGDDLYALFAGILTMRPWNRVIDSSVDHLVIKGTDRSELQVMCLQIEQFDNFC